MDLPESVTVMVLARLRIRDIARLKLVCRSWKSLLESSYFRDLYGTINHKNLTSPWSILYREQSSISALDLFCERWGFTQSLGYCLSRFMHEMKAANKDGRVSLLAIKDGLILLSVSTTKLGSDEMFSVGNPMLRQWIHIPQPPPYSSGYKLQGAALVTDMNNGDLLGYKVVRFGLSEEHSSLHFQMYSSDSGNWTSHDVPTHRTIFYFPSSNPINFNGYLHWLCRDTQVIAYNFYDLTNICHFISLPHVKAKREGGEETLTISCGSLMYMNTNTGEPNQQLKIWRLKNYMSESSYESWELLWKLMPGLDLGLPTNPIAMHPFDKEIVYLVTRKPWHSSSLAYLVSGNLGTKKFKIHKDWKQTHRELIIYHERLLFHQFVLPQRLSSIPCPPGCTLVTLPDQH